MPAVVLADVLAVVLAVMLAIDSASVLFDYSLCCADTIDGQHGTADSTGERHHFLAIQHDITSDDIGMLAVAG